jgi:DNA-binding NtrC family response regulator
MQAVLRYDWPGNVRELRTAVEHGVVMASGAKITLRDLPQTVRNGGGNTPAVAVGAALSNVPKEERLNVHLTEDLLIDQALAETRGNVTQAAKRLGMSRRTLHRRLAQKGGAVADHGKQAQ